METRLFWYTWVAIGFVIGAYIHSGFIRHYLNWFLIKVLSGIIWTLRKSDRSEDIEAETKPPKPTKASPRIDEDELKKILNNPDIRIKGVTK